MSRTYFMAVGGEPSIFSHASTTTKSKILPGERLTLFSTTTTMPSFSLPPIHDNPDGGWGPPSSNLPDQFKFKDIPYAPFSKSDKLGRFADWNDLSGENRQTAAGLTSNQGARGTGPGGRRREGAQAFGSGSASAFAHFHVEDESSFSLVDNKPAPPRRGGFSRGRGAGRGGGGYANRGNTRGGGRGGFSGRGGNFNQRGGRRGWRDWEKVCCIPYTNDSLSNWTALRITGLENRRLLFHQVGLCSKRLNSIVWLNSDWKWTSRRTCKQYWHIIRE